MLSQKLDRGGHEERPESRPVIYQEGMSEGVATVRFEFAYDGGGAVKGGKGTIFINGKNVDEGRIEKTVPARFGVGIDTGSPVSNTYQPPFAFTSQIEKVEIDLAPGKLCGNAEQEIKSNSAAIAKGLRNHYRPHPPQQRGCGPIKPYTRRREPIVTIIRTQHLIAPALLSVQS